MSSSHGHHVSMLDHFLSKKWSFLVSFVLVFFLTLSLLKVFGLGPTASVVSRIEIPGVISTTTTQGPVVARGAGELPTRIEIPSIGLKATVSTPKSTDIPSLDQALLSGAGRYPGSGVPGEEGNVLMFGHSSHLPVVYNQAYKAFNDIQKLKEGEPIFILGTDKVYVYAVEKVEEANTTTGEIPLAVEGAKLTLATCDNFGAKSDRFIVTAKLVSVQDLPKSE